MYRSEQGNKDKTRQIGQIQKGRLYLHKQDEKYALKKSEDDGKLPMLDLFVVDVIDLTGENTGQEVAGSGIERNGSLLVRRRLYVECGRGGDAGRWSRPLITFLCTNEKKNTRYEL